LSNFAGSYYSRREITRALVGIVQCVCQPHGR
jgi:hypothetical protein